MAGARPERELVPLASGLDLELVRREGDGWTLLSARLELDADAPIDRVASETYDALTTRLVRGSACSPVRFWNFIPAIHKPAGDGLDRYRGFNIGRHEALMRWYGSEEAFTRLLPTATGVGHDGRELAVHCLASDQAPAGVENPRQHPAYRYSRRYGPVAPSFARASIVLGPGGRRELIVGGTSSVRGEESVHVGDVRRQLDETLANLRRLIEHAAGGEGEALSRLESVRVYCAREADLVGLADVVRAAFPHDPEIEYLRADICREELLVEIEGVASLDGVGAEG